MLLVSQLYSSHLTSNTTDCVQWFLKAPLTVGSAESSMLWASNVLLPASAPPKVMDTCLLRFLMRTTDLGPFLLWLYWSVLSVVVWSSLTEEAKSIARAEISGLIDGYIGDPTSTSNLFCPILSYESLVSWMTWTGFDFRVVLFWIEPWC